MRQGKQNQYGKIEYMGYMRNLDPVLCLLSALAFYFFNRWGRHGAQPFPSFRQPEDYYGYYVFPGSVRVPERPLSYATQLDWSRKMFRGMGIHAKEKTHSPRKQSVRFAEIRGVPEAQIRRTGRWNTDAMTGVYLSASRVYAVDRGLSATRQHLFPPPRAGDTRRGPLYTDLARSRRLARAYGSLPPRPNRQRGRTARSRGVGISRSSAGAPIILRTKLSLRTSYTLVAALCFPSSICSSDSSVHLTMRILLLLLTPGGSVLFPHECVLLLFLSTPGGSILLPHECISPLILLMMTATSFLISSLVLPPVGSTCFSSLCLFCAIIVLLCSHQVLTDSSCLLCGHHAVEAAQARCLRYFSKRSQRGSCGRQQVVVGGSRKP